MRAGGRSFRGSGVVEVGEELAVFVQRCPRGIHDQPHEPDWTLCLRRSGGAITTAALCFRRPRPPVALARSIFSLGVDSCGGARKAAPRTRERGHWPVPAFRQPHCRCYGNQGSAEEAIVTGGCFTSCGQWVPDLIESELFEMIHVGRREASDPVMEQCERYPGIDRLAEACFRGPGPLPQL